MGIVSVACLAGRVRSHPQCDDDIYLETDQFRCQIRKAICPAIRRPVLDDDVFSLNVTEISQTLHECPGGGE